MKKILFYSFILMLTHCALAKSSQKNTLILTISPLISDHRGGTLYSAAKENFLSEWLPYQDTYIAVDPKRPDIQNVRKWIVTPISNASTLVINLNNWYDLPPDIQKQAIFSHYLRLSAFTFYEISSVDWQGSPYRKLHGSTIRDWVNDWIKSSKSAIDTNCYSVALRATGLHSKYPQEISTETFTENLNDHFYQVQNPETGDLAVFKMDRKYIVHAAVFFGYSSTNSDQKIFLSKNAKGQGVMQFIDEMTLRNKNYPETDEVTYWRRFESEQ